MLFLQVSVCSMSKYRQVLDNFELVQVEAHGGNKVKGLECYGIGLYIIYSNSIGAGCPTIAFHFSIS